MLFEIKYYEINYIFRKRISIFLLMNGFLEFKDHTGIEIDSDKNNIVFKYIKNSNIQVK